MASDPNIDVLKSVAFDAKIPTMLVGAPGVGKTALIRELAEKIDYELIILLGSQINPTDLTGLMKGQKMGETKSGKEIHGTVNLSPDWQVKILTKRKVLLFLDEYSNVPPSTRAGFLTLIQDRRFPNGQVMPEETIVLGAMNPAEESADGFELDLPTKNRFFFMAWDPPASAWYEGMLRAWGKEVSDVEMNWRRKIVAFVKDNPSFLHRQPDENAYNNTLSSPSDITVFESAWPSRRSWDNLARALAKAPSDVFAQDLISKGLVGHSASGDFRNWLRKHDVINPEEAIENPESISWSSLSIDDSNLVLREVEELTNKDNALKVIHLFNVIAESKRSNIAGPYVLTLMKKLGKLKNADVNAAAFAMAKNYQGITKNA